MFETLHRAFPVDGKRDHAIRLKFIRDAVHQGYGIMTIVAEGRRCRFFRYQFRATGGAMVRVGMSGRLSRLCCGLLRIRLFLGKLRFAEGTHQLVFFRFIYQVCAAGRTF